MLLIAAPIFSANSYKYNSSINPSSNEKLLHHLQEITDRNPALNSASSVFSQEGLLLSTSIKHIEPFDLWDVLLMIEITQSQSTAGIGADGDYIYAPERNGSNIYYWDFKGNYQGTFTISGVSNLRDLAYDHETGHMWGGNAGGTCWEMDFNMQTLKNTITGNWQCRAIAYDENEDVFYVSGWGDPVWIIERDGSIIDSFDLKLTTSTYGFAYDRFDTEYAPLLWVHDQGSTGSELRAFSLEEEKFIDDELYYHDVTQEVPGGIAGGLCLHDICPTKYCKLIVNVQASIDTIVSYEWVIRWCCPERDIGVKHINYPESGYADDDLPMQTTFKNNGNNSETFDAQMTVLTSNETGEVLFNENFSTNGTGPNGLPENWTTDWWKWCNFSGNPCACVQYMDQGKGGDYYDNFITSPKINCSGLEQVTLSFSFKADVQYSCYLYLKYRPNATSSWIDITPWENPVAGDFQDWFAIGCYSFQTGGDIGSEFQFNLSYKGYYSYFRCIYLDDVKLESFNSSTEYAEIVEDITIPVGEEKIVDFPSWTPNLWHNESYENTTKEYQIKAEALIDDTYPQNNIKYKLVDLYYPWMHDVGSVTIDGPVSGPAQIFDVTGIIKNFGQYEECCFKTYIEITEMNVSTPEYTDSMCIQSIGPQDEQELKFDAWEPAFLAEETTGTKSYVVNQWTALEEPPDRNPENDLYQNTITLDYFHDVEVTEVVSPAIDRGNRRFYAVDTENYPSSRFIWFDPDNPNVFHDIGPFPNKNFPQSGNFIGKEMWICDTYGNIFKKTEPNSPNITLVGNAGTGELVSLSYHEKSKTLFGMSTSTLYEINQNTGEAKAIGVFGTGTLMITCDCDKRGIMYAHDLGFGINQWYIINLTTGTATAIGVGMTLSYGWMDMEFDWEKNKMVIVTRNHSTGLYELNAINLKTWESTKIATLPRAISCLAIPYFTPVINRYVQPGLDDIDVLATNIGTFPELDMYCSAEIYEFITNCSNGTLVYEDNIIDIDLPDPLGGSKVLNFDSYNFIQEGLYGLFINLSDDNDDNPKNNELEWGIGVDDTPPVSNHTINPPDPDGDNGYYINEPEIRIYAYDPEIGCGHPGSGVNRIDYRLNGGSWQAITGNSGIFTFNVEGNDIIISYRAIDNVGNMETPKSFTINMDQTQPIAEEIAWEAYKKGLRWNVDLIASATDATSGLDRVEFFINDGLHEIIEGDGPDYVFTIQWSEVFRKHSFFFYYYDRAGNEIRIYFNPDNVTAVIKSNMQQSSDPLIKTTHQLIKTERGKNSIYR
jgi:hypothetical protein